MDLKSPEGGISRSIAESYGKDRYSKAEKSDRYDPFCLHTNTSKFNVKSIFQCLVDMFSS